MYDKAELVGLSKKLAERLTKVRTDILDSTIYGGSGQDMQRQGLGRTASELVHMVQSGAERQALVEKARELEGLLQSATATGVIGDRDLQEYLGMIDTIYAALDQEN